MAEQKAEDWWKAIKKGIKRLIVKYDIDPERIAGIGVDGQSWVALPIERDGLPLRSAMIWLDRRAEKQCMWMREKIGGKIIFEAKRVPFYLSTPFHKFCNVYSYVTDEVVPFVFLLRANNT